MRELGRDDFLMFSLISKRPLVRQIRERKNGTAPWCHSSAPRNGEHQLSFPLKTRKRKKSDGNKTIAPATSA